MSIVLTKMQKLLKTTMGSIVEITTVVTAEAALDTELEMAFYSWETIVKGFRGCQICFDFRELK